MDHWFTIAKFADFPSSYVEEGQYSLVGKSPIHPGDVVGCRHSLVGQLLEIDIVISHLEDNSIRPVTHILHID